MAHTSELAIYDGSAEFLLPPGCRVTMDGVIAFAAQWLIAVPAVLVAVAIAVRRRWRGDLIEAAIAGVATIVLVKLSGALHFETRPFITEHVHPLVAHAADNAFPSDHLAAAGLACAYLWPRYPWLSMAVLLFAAAIGAARVAARLHWPGDIAVGFAIGLAGAALARLATRLIAPAGSGRLRQRNISPR